MPGWTNRGKMRMLGIVFNGVAAPVTFNVALVTSAVAPTADTDTLGQLTEIAPGNGYTAGGINLARNVTDFPGLTEDDVNDRGNILVRDLVWTASGGTLPASGGGARWAVLTDANATVGSREVWAFWDLGSDRSVSSGQTLTLDDPGLRLAE